MVSDVSAPKDDNDKDTPLGTDLGVSGSELCQPDLQILTSCKSENQSPQNPEDADPRITTTFSHFASDVTSHSKQSE